MTESPIPGAGKRRRRRRGRGGGNAQAAPQTAAGGLEDDKGKAFPDVKPSSIDFDAVAGVCLKARHMEVFNWMRKSLGKTSEQLITEIVRAAVISEAPNYREAHGQVSMSSRNIETLVNR